MRRDPKLVLAVSAAILLSACSRDLDVPAPSSAPRIGTFSPAAAYAGELLTIRGSGLDADPVGNLVQFARASARAESASSGSISVRVPADAGDGPITVTTKGGVSAPAETAFTYLGRGELTAHAVTDELPMLHKPYRVVPARDETFLHSDLLLGVVRYGDPSFVDAAAVSLDQARWTLPDPSVVWLESEGVSTLVRQTVSSTGVVTTAARAGIAYAGVGPIVAMRASGGRPDVVAVFRYSSGTYSVALHRLDTLAVYQAAQPIAGLTHLRGCTDAGGDLACLGRNGPDLSAPLKVVRIRFTPAPVATFSGAPPAPVVEDHFLPEDPLCADTTMHRAVVALTDGRVASIDASTLTSGAVLTATSTGSRTPARSLTCVPGSTGYGTATGPTVLVSKLGDDLLTRLDPTTGQVRWSAAVPSASYAGLWCPDSACASGVVHAAGEADNGVLLLDLATGALVARRSFDVGAGRVHAPNALLDRTGNQGAAWYDPSEGPPTLAFLTTSPPGVIEWPLTAQRGSGLYPHFRNASDAVAVVPWLDAVKYETVRSRRFVTASTSWGQDGFAPSFLGTAQLAVDNNEHIHFATAQGLETVDWNTHVVSLVDFSPAEYMSLVRLPHGMVVAGLLAGNGNWYAVGWTEAAAAAGGLPPTWQWPPVSGRTPWPSMVVAAVRLEGQLRVFFWDAQGNLHAVALREDGVEVPGSDQVLYDPLYSVLAVSPNGRTFVSWDFQPFSRDTSLVVWSGDADAGFPRLATIPLQGQISGAAFDASGERLYVITRNPDRIVVIQ